MADGRSVRGGALVGSCAGLRLPGPGPAGGLSHGPVSRKRKEAGPGPQGKRDAARGRSGPGDQGNPAVPSTPRGCPLIRDPAGRRGYQERWVHHTRAHTPREHAQCGPGNFLPSLKRPRPPPRPMLPKLGAAQGLEGGRGARRSPFGVLVLCIAPARPLELLSSAAPTAGNRGVDVTHPRSPRPGPRPGGQRPGGGASCRVDMLAMRSPHARTQCCKQTE